MMNHTHDSYCVMVAITSLFYELKRDAIHLKISECQKLVQTWKTKNKTDRFPKLRKRYGDTDVAHSVWEVTTARSA